MHIRFGMRERFEKKLKKRVVNSRQINTKATNPDLFKPIQTPLCTSSFGHFYSCAICVRMR